MSVVSELAKELEDMSTRPPDADVATLIRMYVLMGAAAHVLRLLEERVKDTDAILRNPPRVIDFEMDPKMAAELERPRR